MSNSDVENDKPKGFFTTLVADGGWLYSKGEYKKAIDAFMAALALKPDDKHCYVGCSKCYLKMGQSEMAFQNAEASLKGDNTFFEGIYQKAEALYYMAEFEFALVFYHRGQKLRPQIHGFRLGIQKAQEAIENSVGNPSVKLQTKGDLTFLKEDEERSEPITAIHNLTKEKRQMNQKIPKIDNKIRLGAFYDDKKYLEHLMKDEDLLKGTTKEGEHLQDVLKNCLTYLETCTEFWNQEKPIPPRDRSHSIVPYKSSEHAFLLASLNEIDEALTSGDAKGSLKKAEEAMKVVQKWSEKELPNKKEILGSLHSCIGHALMELGDMEKALEHHSMDLQLAKRGKLPEAMSRALDNIGRVYADMDLFDQAIVFWEKKIPLAFDGLERTWLFHELGWCYLEIHQYEDALYYGGRSVTEANGIGDEKWQMNAIVLMAQSELNMGKYESSVSSFEKALVLAKRQKDLCAITAIHKALVAAKHQLAQKETLATKKE